MKFQFSLVAVLFALFLLPASTSRSQTLAFPGALGYGAYATGGRNGTVYHVTNLNDSGAGSFRDAVSHSGRTVVFDVGGHINLISAVSVQGNTTIAGQTAPGGISLDAGEVSFSSRANIICRYLRIRPGSSTASANDDCLGLYQSTNVIVDHCSLEFGPYDNIDAVTANNLSFQHCIDANPTGQQFGAHIENVGAFCSWHYNIFANSHNRNPLAKINDTFINNVLYNCSAGYTTHTSTRFNHDIVNNYFIAGPAYGSSTDFPWFQVDNNQSIYYSGNLFDSNENGVLDGGITTPYWYQGGSGGTVLTAPWSSWTTIIPTMSPALAWRYAVSTDGAFPRDDVDSLLISQIKTVGSGTSGTGAGTSGPGSGLYTSQTQTGLGNNGYGSITGGTAPANFSGDGIADYWKLANGLNTNTAYPLTNTITGYTLLENYLNFLAGPHAVTQTNTPVDINLAQFTGGFSAGATFNLTNATNGTVTLLNSTNAHFVPTANFSGLGVFTFAVNDNGYSLNVGVTVCITPAAPPASAIAFNGAIITAATNSAAASAPPANLLWHGDGVANAWNTTTSNFLNGAAASLFKNGDVVTFDDSGSTNPPVTLTGTLAPGAMIFNNSAENYVISGTGAWNGSGSLSKTGTGTLTVNTTNSGFGGAISVNGGALTVGPSASIGSGNINLSGGAVLTTSSGGSAITVPGSISIAASDSATLSAGQLGNEYSGALSSGDTNTVLNLSNGVSFNGTASSQFSGFTGTINIPVGSTLRFAVASSGNNFGSLNPNFIINGTLQPRNAGNTITLGALNGSGQITGPQTAGTGSGNTVYNIGGKNLNAVFNGIIVSNANSAGSAICVNKLGTGTQTLNGNNTFTGTNAVIAGTLLLNGANMPALVTVFANATLGGTGAISGPVTVNSGGILSPGAGGPGTLTLNGNLTTTSPTLNFDLSPSPSGANDRINLGGALAMTGVQTFNFNLTGAALGAGTYSLIEGATNSSQSGVSLASNLPGNTRQSISLVSAPAGSNPSYVRLLVSGDAGSLLWLGTNGGNWDFNTINWSNGNGADQYYNLDTVTFDDTSTNGAVSLVNTLQPGAILVTNNSLAYTFSGNGALTGPGVLTKAGSGTLVINTTNSSYSGAINLTGGTLAVSSGASIGSGSLTIGNGATFALPGNGSSVFFGGPVSVPTGQTANITSGVLSSGFSGTFSSGNAASLLNLSGGFSFSGVTSAQFDNFTGTINLPPGGTLRYSANSSGNVYGSFSPTFVINGTVLPRNAGNTIQLGAFSGSGTLAGPQSNSGSGDTLYVIGGNNTSATFTGIISSNSAVAGNQVILSKIGTGKLTLGGASTFTGGTTVNAGTLCVTNSAGSATGAGDLEVFAGAALTGNGVIGSATTIDNGATLAPGDATGTLTISNNLALNDNSLLQFALGTNSSSVAVSGDLALTGRLTVTNAGGFGPGSYPLFTCNGALSIGNLVLVSAPTGYSYNFDTTTPGDVKLVVAPPAPPIIARQSIGAGGQFVFSGSGGTPGGTYYVVTSTNLAAPASSWVPIFTNQFDDSGNFTVTNLSATNLQSFYRLKL